MILDSFIFKVTTEVGEKKATILEERIRILLKPKPKWMSEHVWKWLINKLIYISYERR